MARACSRDLSVLVDLPSLQSCVRVCSNGAGRGGGAKGHKQTQSPTALPAQTALQKVHGAVLVHGDTW
jgi:hypothetical protein